MDVVLLQEILRDLLGMIRTNFYIMWILFGFLVIWLIILQREVMKIRKHKR